MDKIRVSIRLNPHNYDLVKSVADLLFFNENKNKGDLSKSLNWILNTFKNNTEFSALCNMLISYDRYQHGSRTEIDIEKTKQLFALLKVIDDTGLV